MSKVDVIYRFASFYLIASQGLVSSKEEAAKILGVPPNASPEDINKAYKQKALKLHPDVNPGGDPLEMKILNSAKEVMLAPNEVWLPETAHDGVRPQDISYEDIADIRREMGRDEFERAYPGWESELKGEMGMDGWNSTFEGYDPNDSHESHWEDNTDEDSKWDSARDTAQDFVYDWFSEQEDAIPELADKVIWVEGLREMTSETFKEIPEVKDKADYIKKVYKYTDRQVNSLLSDALHDLIRRRVHEYKNA